jgi:glucose/mannose-6-phosphate isomerase
MQIEQYVQKFDPDNLFAVLKNSYQQIEYAWANQFDLGGLKNSKISAIIVTGLGGSAIAGNFAQNFLKDELRVPLTVNRNYNLPLSADENTLVIASSYSGETEETISALQDAISRKCKVICVTTGGTVEKIANGNGFPVVKLQKGFQPRFAFGVSFFSLLKILQEINLIPSQSEVVKNIISQWKARGEELATDGNAAYQLAEKIVGKIPVILSTADVSDAVGVRIKGQFNENSKLAAFHNSLPEQNHNEIVPWEYHKPEVFPAILIELKDAEYHPRVAKRFEIITGLIKKSGCEVITLESKEASFKERLADLLYFGDWISYYTAVLRQFDPKEINFILYLKSELQK